MTNKNHVIKVFVRLFWFIFFSAIVITSSVLIKEYGPDRYIFTDASFDFSATVPTEIASNNNIIFDQHSHTLYSDGVLTVEQNILWHISHGFNACVITDHDTLDNKDDIDAMREKYKDQIVIIQGIEWTTWRIHMNFLGITNWSIDIPNEPTDEEIQNAIDAAHAQDAVVTVNHIPWSLRVGMDDHPTRQQLLEWGVDYIEVVNEHEFDTESWDNWCNDTGGFGVITGTDMHSPDKVSGYTGMNVSISNFNVEGIMAQLRDRNTTILFVEDGIADESVKSENVWYEIAAPAAMIGDMFETVWDGSIDWVKVGIFAGYLIGAFVIAEIIRFANNKFWEKKNSKRTEIAETN